MRVVDTELVGYTGRFQPFHMDHLEMVHTALGLAQRVVIGVTNPDPTMLHRHAASAHRHLPDANPFTYEERSAMITAALATDSVSPERVRIVPFPLESAADWPSLLPPGTPQLVRVFSDWEREKVRRFDGAGYPAIVLEGNPLTRISGTEIRRRLACDEPWEQWVPPGARELVARFYSRIHAKYGEQRTAANDPG